MLVQPAIAAPRAPVVRREFRSLSYAEQDRFCNAVDRMMANMQELPRSSEFFRIAGHHGWPGHYCNHGIESFPVWHRAYMLEFEGALQAADVANGGDGKLALPYWVRAENQLDAPLPPALSTWSSSPLLSGLDRNTVFRHHPGHDTPPLLAAEALSIPRHERPEAEGISPQLG